MLEADMLTPVEASAWLVEQGRKAGPALVGRLCQAGQVPGAFKREGRWLLPRTSLEVLLARPDRRLLTKAEGRTMPDRLVTRNEASK